MLLGILVKPRNDFIFLTLRPFFSVLSYQIKPNYERYEMFVQSWFDLTGMLL